MRQMYANSSMIYINARAAKGFMSQFRIDFPFELHFQSPFFGPFRNFSNAICFCVQMWRTNSRVVTTHIHRKNVVMISFSGDDSPEKLSQPFFVVFDGNIEQQTPIRIIESMVVRDSNISIHSRAQYSIAECLLSHRNHIHTMERVRERATDVCGVNKRQMC